MADIVIAAAAKVVELLVKPIICEGQYLFCVNKVIKNLHNEKKKLISEMDRILSLEEQAKMRTEIIEDAVKKWLNDVKNILEEVDKLEEEMKANHCFQGPCPTWRRYCLCKETTKTTKTITDLKNNSKFEPFSHLAPIPGIGYFSSQDFTYFESTKVAYSQLVEALQDENTYMIGLYGMGGSGKTTLVTEVGKKALELKLFDRVILVTVSQTPNIESIQEKMADMLGFKLEEKTKEGRAQRLWLRLQEEKRVLIIVDDVWVKLNLENIGIQLDDNIKLNFKVLLTTRLRRVCTSMNCQREIFLDLLSKEEAWTLFWKHACISDESSSNLLKVARDVSNECKGLPIAIKAMGSSLKGNGYHEWKTALESLRHAKPFDDHEEEGMIASYTCLKLSYDYLRNKEAEMLFLMCSMFPEDHEIFIEDLIRYGVGLGVCGKFESFDIARSRIRVGLNKLVDSCLLFYFGPRESHVKMHDMVRDVSIWIASKSEHHKIIINLTKELNTIAEDGAMKDCFAISSWNKETELISHQLDSPKLKILLLNTINSENSLELSFASFEGVKELKVMAIINGFYTPSLFLPQTTNWLTNLRTLHLSRWDLGDMSFLITLTRLEVLDLHRCKFKELPKGMEKLNKLKLLDLSCCQVLENFNFEAIGSCSQLEELYAFGLSPCERIEDIVTLPNLQRFVIQLGWFRSFDYEESNRVVHLLEFNISNLGASKQNLLQIAEVVCLECLLGGCKNIIPDMVRVVGGMTELTNLCFYSCSKIECLIDTTCHDDVGLFEVNVLLPKLVKLELCEMDNLKELCRGPTLLVLDFFKKLEQLFIRYCKQLYSIFPSTCNLCNLKILKIGNYGNISCNWEFYDCTAVEALFSMSVAQSLQQLEELFVEGCMQLKHIITSGGEDGTYAGDNSNLMFPNLKKLHISFCSKLEFIFPISVIHQGLLQLQELKISHAFGLKYVFGQDDHESHSSQQNQVQIMLPLLKVFNLEDLENLIGICPESSHLRCPSLELINWVRCPKLSTLCINVMVLRSELRQQHLNKGVAQEQLISKLQHLLVRELPELRFIWSGTTPRPVLSFQYLQRLEVYRCANLKSVFPMAIEGSLLELTSLSICHCEELEEIISENKECQNLSTAEMFFPKLSDLKIKKCNKLKSLFSVAMVKMLPKLTTIHISKAAQLEEAFRYGSVDKTDNEDQNLLPNLRKLALRRLPSFVHLCQGFKLQVPKLQELRIDECPKFSPILNGTQVFPFQHKTEKKEVFWLITATSNQLCNQMLSPTLQAFLNFEILAVRKNNAEAIFQLQVEGELSSNNKWKPLKSKLDRLLLLDLPELIFIWNGFSKFLSLDKLKEVSLFKCSKLKIVFPPSIVRCLPMLEELWISNCEELEEIIFSDSENAFPQNQVCFPHLYSIKVEQCNKLKCLFHDSMAFNFPKLESLVIQDCSQLEQVFGYKGEVDESHRRGVDKVEGRILFPKLEELIITSLPIFFEIFPGFHLQQPLRNCLVKDCPKYNSTSTTAEGIVPDKQRIQWPESFVLGNSSFKFQVSSFS